ncbi:hypothetical protein BGW38_004512 [Lunasporangiospora selenospora]|uniref:Arrestin C-terminal-like domain-containing protein n=1 Tax=Lunasporangiospora selenospora TaxID=979761 RepID=A0A9P6FQ19_9FUNG|nr:hypothetical protein BGW38_004512 [Lunasporangiospora selenospora]
MVHAQVTFETSQDVRARAVEISFKAVCKTHYFSQDEASRKLEGTQIFYSKQWELDVERPKPGYIRQGCYARQVSVVLDPSWPSSAETPFGSMRYLFEARLKGGKGISLARVDWVVTQEVWVLNSKLPHPQLVDFGSGEYRRASRDLGSMDDDLLIVDPVAVPTDPVVVRGRWKNHLSYSLTVPSETLYLGQVFPILIEFHTRRLVQPLSAIQMTNASFVLKESRTYRATFVHETFEMVEKLLQVSVHAGWPTFGVTKQGEGVSDNQHRNVTENQQESSRDSNSNRDSCPWKRTIHVSLPSSPTLSTSIRTKYLDIQHMLEVILEFQMSTNPKSERLCVPFELQITAPRPIPLDPPEYGEQQHQTMVEATSLLEPPPAIDSEDELPTYSRYE